MTFATLIAGCEFVSRNPVMIDALALDPATRLTAKVHMRVTANRMRELDRFLAVMLNEAAGRIGGAAHDAEQFDRISNTSKKLHAVELLMGMAGADHARLRAMGRIAARLRGASHHWRALSMMSDLAMMGDLEFAEAEGGAGKGARRDPSHGKGITSLSLNLVTISAFYQAIGHRLADELTNKNCVS